MKDMIGAIILVVIANTCFAVSYFQFNEKGVLFNNAYIFASKQEREIMEKKLHYKQSGVVFLLMGIIFLLDSIDMILKTGWLFYCVIMIAVATIVYAVISSITIENRNNTPK